MGTSVEERGLILDFGAGYLLVGLDDKADLDFAVCPLSECGFVQLAIGQHPQ